MCVARCCGGCVALLQCLGRGLVRVELMELRFMVMVSVLPCVCLSAGCVALLLFCCGCYIASADVFLISLLRVVLGLVYFFRKLLYSGWNDATADKLLP